MVAKLNVVHKGLGGVYGTLVSIQNFGFKGQKQYLELCLETNCRSAKTEVICSLQTTSDNKKDIQLEAEGSQLMMVSGMMEGHLIAPSEATNFTTLNSNKMHTSLSYYHISFSLPCPGFYFDLDKQFYMSFIFYLF